MTDGQRHGGDTTTAIGPLNRIPEAIRRAAGLVSCCACGSIMVDTWSDRKSDIPPRDKHNLALSRWKCNNHQGGGFVTVNEAGKWYFYRVPAPTTRLPVEPSLRFIDLMRKVDELLQQHPHLAEQLQTWFANQNTKH